MPEEMKEELEAMGAGNLEELAELESVYGLESKEEMEAGEKNGV